MAPSSELSRFSNSLKVALVLAVFLLYLGVLPSRAQLSPGVLVVNATTGVTRIDPLTGIRSSMGDWLDSARGPLTGVLALAVESPGSVVALGNTAGPSPVRGLVRMTLPDGNRRIITDLSTSGLTNFLPRLV